MDAHNHGASASASKSKQSSKVAKGRDESQPNLFQMFKVKAASSTEKAGSQTADPEKSGEPAQIEG